jgi:hypothetical protein
MVIGYLHKINLAEKNQKAPIRFKELGTMTEARPNPILWNIIG